MNLLERMPEQVPDLFGKYPVVPFPNGYAWRKRRSWEAVVVSGNVNYWDNGWKVMDDRPVQDHSGVWTWPYAPGSRIHPNGAIFDGPRPYRMLSMGVLEGERYIPLWQPGSLKVGDGALVTQALGPFDVVTNFENCGRKQTILLPEMPSLAGGSIAIEYAVENMLAPEKCGCRPEVIDGRGVVVPMAKRRTERGRLEFLPLDVLERLAFPVVLDPTYDINASGPWARGQRSTYALARASASSWSSGLGCAALGQGFSVATYFVQRVGLKVNMNSAPDASGAELNKVYVKDSCCSTAVVADTDDTIVFKQADWSAWDPPDLWTIENVYDTIRTSTLGADLWTIFELQNLGCFASPNCIMCDWKELSAADVAYLSTHYWNLAPPDRMLYGGLMSKNDHNNLAPTGLSHLWQAGGSALCGRMWRVDYGGGAGWVWVVS